MHDSTCNCPKCRSGNELGFEVLEFPMTQETYEEFEAGNKFGEIYSENPFSEAEEMELAMELLSISTEEELDQFLGKFLKRAWKGVKKVGAGIAKVARPFLKTALPLVGGALGSFIPIPGVGTAVGRALGGAIGKALEMEFAGMEPEDREFELARRFVRIAGSAAQQAAQAAPNRDPKAVMQVALVAAARRHVPQLAQKKTAGFTPSRPATGSSLSGRWLRRGSNIVVLKA